MLQIVSIRQGLVPNNHGMSHSLLNEFTTSKNSHFACEAFDQKFPNFGVKKFGNFSSTGLLFRFLKFCPKFIFYFKQLKFSWFVIMINWWQWRMLTSKSKLFWRVWNGQQDLLRKMMWLRIFWWCVRKRICKKNFLTAKDC